MSHKIRSWFDGFDKILALQAEVSGLLEHIATVGQIREFFVKNVFEKFLPSEVTVGSGQILSSKDDELSKQIDIIIYDNRFPEFSIKGSEMNALYPVEGVIATIEIKTNLDSVNTLNTALDNCLSAMKLPFEIKSKEQTINKYSEKYNLTPEIAEQQFIWELSPKTYIFAFNSS